MLKPETNIVQPDPARISEERCFYCEEPIGAEHKTKCVMRTKTVVIEMTTEFVAEVPEYWDADKINFHRNESTFCADNTIESLERHISERGEECWCGVFKFSYVRDASEEDESSLPHA